MLLMDLSADVWAVDQSGWSPILHAAAQDDLDFARDLVNRVSKPRDFPEPDPSRFIVLGEGDTAFGVPTWILIALVVLILSIAVVIPGCKIIRRFQRAAFLELFCRKFSNGLSLLSGFYKRFSKHSPCILVILHKYYHISSQMYEILT